VSFHLALDDGGVVEIKSLNNGHLKCSGCEKYWCSHIQFAIMGGLDRDDLWDNLSSDSGLLSDTLIMVPYVPALEIWPKVQIREEEAGGRAIYLSHPETGDDEHLGTLFPGEGRNVIRDLIHNWFVPQQFTAEGKRFELVCKSTSHKIMEQSKLQAHMKSEKFIYGELWLIKFTHMCHSCNVIHEQAMSGLVPSV
jgi:hypothetical protein